SSPALTDRACVTDTRRSLGPWRPNHFGSNGRCLAGQNIVYRMAFPDEVEDDSDGHDDPHRYEDGDLKRRPVNATASGRYRAKHAGREQAWPEREDRGSEGVQPCGARDDPGAHHAPGNSVRPGR